MAELKQINVDGVDYDIVGKELTKITYAELKALRDNGQLSEGHLYRITDYVTTTVQTNTKSAGNVFDVIVLAVSANELSHIARAIQHEGDTYFDGNDLGAWELWYDLDNDIEKYAWADATNGKGVIYRMIDEKRNDCPYDFKNILFYTTSFTDNTTSDEYYYTFSYVVSSKLYDGTVEKQVAFCHSNSMRMYIYSKHCQTLNKNVFRNKAFSHLCYSNTLELDCYNNTFGNNCCTNTFKDGCNHNTLGDGCSGNTFGTTCYGNTFVNDCDSNTFGASCYGNTLGKNCRHNVFGNSCSSNTLDGECMYNSFESVCKYNTLGYQCQYNTFGYKCEGNTFKNYCQRRHLDHNKTSITLNDEYYDDDSGKLVPIKHPDLSTQPSILPYKFMGQYVYEQLIPDVNGSAYLGMQQLAVSNPLFLSIVAIQQNKFNGNDAVCWIEDNQFKFTTVNIPFETPIYYRIVYTSMPEEGDYYYNMDNTGIRFYVEAAANYRAFMPNVSGEELPVLKDGSLTYIFASAATIQRLCENPSDVRIELNDKCYSVTVSQGSGEAYIDTDGRTVAYSGDDWRNSTVEISVG